MIYLQMQLAISVMMLTSIESSPAQAIPRGQSRPSLLRFYSTGKFYDFLPKNSTYPQVSPQSATTTTEPGTKGVSTESAFTRILICERIIDTDPVIQVFPTILETQGRPSLPPFPTSFIAPSVSLTSPLSTQTAWLPSVPANASNETNIATLLKVRSPLLIKMGVTDIFQPVASGAPPRQIPSRGDHPAPRLGIVREEYIIIVVLLTKIRVGPSKKSNIYE